MTHASGASAGQVAERNFDAARELVDALDVSRDEWSAKSGRASPWIFRGQARAEWGLLPPAWRPQQRESGAPIARMLAALEPYTRPPDPLRDAPHERAVFGQAMAEIALVSAFVALTDDLGIPVPDQELVPQPFDLEDRDWIARVRALAQPYEHDASEDVWRPRSSSFAANSAFALAQHHRIPTRLLDWTHDPLVAAYFAAEEVRPSQDGTLAVWAVRRQDVQRCRAIGLCQVPRSHISYLHAQSGLFLVHRAGETVHLERGEWPDLLEPLLALGGEVVRKLTLPHAQAPELSRILWRRRISRAHMMPTYDSVTAALQRQWELMDL